MKVQIISFGSCDMLDIGHQLIPVNKILSIELHKGAEVHIWCERSDGVAFCHHFVGDAAEAIREYVRDRRSPARHLLGDNG